MTRITTLCPVCQCTFCDSDCVKRHGNGSVDDPYTFETIVDPAEGNLYECGPSGQAVFIPPYVLDPPACHIYSSIHEDLIAPNEVPWVLNFNEERYDTDSMHDVDDDVSKIVFNTAGIYRVTLNVTWHKNNLGDRAAFIWKNRSDFLAFEARHAGDADLYVGMSVTVKESFEAGDFVEAVVKQDSGVDLWIERNRYSPNFTASFRRLNP